MLVNIALFILGFIFLVKGSDSFVKSAASISKRLGVSEFVIGLTLVAIGTSMPELVSGITASLKHQSGIVIGNVVGSNISNVGLIIGLAALIAIMKTDREMLERDGYIMAFVAALFFLFIYDARITSIEAFVLLLVYVAYLVYLFEAKPKLRGRYHFREFFSYFLRFRYLVTIKDTLVARQRRKDETLSQRDVESLRSFRRGLAKDLVVMAVGASIVVVGANFLVDQAVFFSSFFDVPQSLIAMSIISFGTTLPELSVAISATRKGYANIAVGNAIGSVIANIALVLAVAGLVNPLSVSNLTLYYGAPFMALMLVLFLVFIRSKWQVRRFEGALLFALYLTFIAVLFLIGGTF